MNNEHTCFDNLDVFFISPRPAMYAVCWQHRPTKLTEAAIASSVIWSLIQSKLPTWKKIWRAVATLKIGPFDLLSMPTKKSDINRILMIFWATHDFHKADIPLTAGKVFPIAPDQFEKSCCIQVSWANNFVKFNIWVTLYTISFLWNLP